MKKPGEMVEIEVEENSRKLNKMQIPGRRHLTASETKQLMRRPEDCQDAKVSP